MREQKVSARYANALMDVASDSDSLDFVLKDLIIIDETLMNNRNLKKISDSPVVPDYKKKAIYKEIFSDAISETTLKFIILLIDKNRINLIDNIKNEFVKLYNLKFGRQTVSIISAIELNETIKKNLIHKLSVETGKTILPSYSVDKSLKGGFKIQIDDMVYDASIQGQLHLLHKKLKAN